MAASCKKGPDDIKHMISNNLHLKSSAKNGSSNWVLIQGAIFTVSILIVVSRLLSLPSCYLVNEMGKKLKTKNGQNMLSGPFSHDTAHVQKTELHGILQYREFSLM